MQEEPWHQGGTANCWLRGQTASPFRLASVPKRVLPPAGRPRTAGAPGRGDDICSRRFRSGPDAAQVVVVGQGLRRNGRLCELDALRPKSKRREALKLLSG